MNDKPHSPFTISDLADIQKTFFKAWSDAAPANLPPMDLWSSALPNDAQRTWSNLIGQAHIYNLIGEQLSALMNQYNNLDKTSKDWQRQLETCFNQMKTIFSAQGLSGLLQQIPGSPMGGIHSAPASWMPGDFLQSIKNTILQPAAEKYLSVPGLGYTRESQEQSLKSIRLWSKYQSALQDFNNASSRIAFQALEKLRETITQLGQQDKNISSLRQIYDLWIDANESAYAEFIGSKEYPPLYGALVNSLAEYQRHTQQIVDQLLEAMNIPTQKEIDTLKKRQQELRREIHPAGRQTKPDDRQIKQLAHRLEQLTGRLEAIESAAKSGAVEAKSNPSSPRADTNKKDSKNAPPKRKKKTRTKITAKKATAKKATPKRRKKSPAAES